MKRNLVLCLSAMTLVASLGSIATAQTVTLSLDLFYNDPGDTTSAGSWQLLASADSVGLAGLDTQITGLTGTTNEVFTAPTPAFKETYNGGLSPWNLDQDGDPATLDMLFGQIPVASGVGAQDLQYNVGTAGGTTPNVDELGVVVDTSGAAMTDAVLLAFGSFGANSTPAFGIGETGANVFSVIPANPADDPPAPATILQAVVTTQLRDNTATLSGDLNLDKSVAGADLLGLLPNLGTQDIWQSGDITGDTLVAGADLLSLLPNLGLTAPAVGAGVASVPEPSSMVLLALAGVCLGLSRRSRLG